MRKMIVASAFAFGLGSGPAIAGCYHNGVYYDPGSVICSEGWLQECTVADYWSAIGMCHAGDVLGAAGTPDILALALGTAASGAAQSLPADTE